MEGDEAGAPTEPVVTRRLILSPVSRDDVDDLWNLYRDPQVSLWTGPWTRAEVEAWTADMTQRWSTDGIGKWVARRQPDDVLVGRGGFTCIDLEGEALLELGWAVRDAYTGLGYATELGLAALAWADEHHRQLPVVAFTEVHNHRSRAVMERLGMRQVGSLRRPGLVEGRTGMHANAPFVLYRR